MCLIALAWRASPRWPLVVVANRDEDHERPSAALGVWPDAPHVVGGRDMLEGGSWMAVSRDGRLAAVTNVREPQRDAQFRSRGQLVREFVLGSAAARDAALQVVAAADAYRPFNLLLWDGRELFHASKRPLPDCSPLPAGVHGISNGPLDAPWPKVRWLVASLQAWLARAGDEPDVAPLFAALASERRAPLEELPSTGVPAELELRLSAPFIRGARYGTRASTVMLLDAGGRATLIERGFGPDAAPLGERRAELALQRC